MPRVERVEDIAPVLGLDTWTSAGRRGAAALERESRRLDAQHRRRGAELDRIVTELADAAANLPAEVNAAVAQANSLNPDRPTTQYEGGYDADGRFHLTPKGRSQWFNDRQLALAAWIQVTDLIEDAADLLRDADRAVESDPHSPYWTVVLHHEASLEAIAELSEAVRESQPGLEDIYRDATNLANQLRVMIRRGPGA